MYHTRDMSPFGAYSIAVLFGLLALFFGVMFVTQIIRPARPKFRQDMSLGFFTLALAFWSTGFFIYGAGGGGFPAPRLTGDLSLWGIVLFAMAFYGPNFTEYWSARRKTKPKKP